MPRPHRYRFHRRQAARWIAGNQQTVLGRRNRVAWLEPTKFRRTKRDRDFSGIAFLNIPCKTLHAKQFHQNPRADLERSRAKILSQPAMLEEAAGACHDGPAEVSGDVWSRRHRPHPSRLAGYKKARMRLH